MDKGIKENYQDIGATNLYDDAFDDLKAPEIQTDDAPIIDVTEPLSEDIFTEKTPDLVFEVLKSKNINPEAIKFENDEGEIEERKWGELTFEEQKNIIQSDDLNIDYGLEDSEIEIINNFRNSKLSYEEYIQSIKNQAIEEHLQENNPYRVYSVDEINDDELYLLDLKNRTSDLTDEELISSLENEKTNETLYGKKITSLRNEYKALEDQKILAEQELSEQENNRLIEGFHTAIHENVAKLESIGNLQLSAEERTNVYKFITDTDTSGETLISKALNDPEQLVKMAWFALYGEQGFNVIQDYFTKELANSRKSKSSLVYTDKNTKENKTTDKPKINSMGSLYNLD